jgi:L-threonylcarbamoyladenylate synthase
VTAGDVTDGNVADNAAADGASRPAEGDVAGDAGIDGAEGAEDGAAETDEHADEPAQPTYARYDCTDSSNHAGIAEAASAARRALEDGECIVLPTDTVYGIGADAYNADAVQRLLDAKGRGREKPPPVLISDANLVKALAVGVPDQAINLVEALWPGALTIICKAQEHLRMDLGETRGTVGLRVPDHALTRELLRQTGPLAVSSANKTGQPPALSCDNAVEQLGDSVSVYLDGGELNGTQGKPSTIIDFTIKETGQILRRGALGLERLREYLPDIEDLTEESADGDQAPRFSVAELRARHTLQPPLPSDLTESPELGESPEPVEGPDAGASTSSAPSESSVEGPDAGASTSSAPSEGSVEGPDGGASTSSAPSESAPTEGTAG